MASLYANENFPLQVVEALRALGHDVLTSLEAGQANQAIADDRVLAFAAQHGRALLTLNRRDSFKRIPVPLTMPASSFARKTPTRKARPGVFTKRSRLTNRWPGNSSA